MVEVPRANPLYVDLLHMLFSMGLFGLVLLLVAVALGRWLWILFFRAGSLSDYVAYLAATFYPFLFAGIGGTVGAVHFLRVYTNPPGIGAPQMLVYILNAEIFYRILGGSMLTVFFLTLGILALLIRKPK